MATYTIYICTECGRVWDVSARCHGRGQARHPLALTRPTEVVPRAVADQLARSLSVINRFGNVPEAHRALAKYREATTVGT